MTAGRSAVAALLLLGNTAFQSQPPSGPIRSTPFAVGERLVYHVQWSPPWYLFFLPTMDAGEVELSVAEETRHKENRAIKIVFNARSSGTLAKMAGVKIDDHFEFLTDSETLCTFSVTKKVREGKRKRDIDVVYHPEKKRLHFREVDVAAVPPKVRRDELVEGIPECVQDVFSALYLVRRQELSGGMSHRSLLGDNDRVKEVVAQVEKKEVIETPKGKYETWRINTVAVLGGLFRAGGEFRIWLTTDERRLPVQFEATASLGKVSGKLKELHP
jgi:Protein of unknown function (DUF3108)